MDPLSLPDVSQFGRRRRTRNADETRALGVAIAAVLRGGDALLLHGPLGAGKTCLVQGICEGLGVGDEVVSPTFTLVNRYPGRPTVDHLDFYRVEPDHDLGDIGVLDLLDDLADGTSVLVAEWPNLLEPLVPVRVELLAEIGESPEERSWYVRGVPDLPAAWLPLFPEESSGC